jgi:hypothetical protein
VQKPSLLHNTSSRTCFSSRGQRLELAGAEDLSQQRNLAFRADVGTIGVGNFVGSGQPFAKRGAEPHELERPNGRPLRWMITGIGANAPGAKQRGSRPVRGNVGREGMPPEASLPAHGLLNTPRLLPHGVLAAGRHSRTVHGLQVDLNIGCRGSGNLLNPICAYREPVG